MIDSLILFNHNLQKQLFSLVSDWSKMEFNLQRWVHKKCDYKPNKLIIIKSTNRNVFRGYTDQSWSGNGIYKADQNALIFSRFL